MTDLSPFDPTPAPVNPPAAPQKRNRRQRAAAPPATSGRPNGTTLKITPATAGRPNGPTPKITTAKKPGRPRKTAAEPVTSPKLRLDLGVIVQACAGMRPEDVDLFVKIAQGLQKVPAKSRTRIVSALGQVLG